MLGRYAFYNLSMEQIRPVFYFCTRRFCSTDNKYELITTHQHNSGILKILNYKSSNYLSRFKIPVSQIHVLLSHREKYGLYKSLQDVLEVEGMTESILNEFLQSLLTDKQYQRVQRSKKTLIIPMVENITEKNISTVLGIYIGTNVVTWTLVDIKENVLEWNYENFLGIRENGSTLDLLEMASKLNSRLPKSDVYVVDEITYDTHRGKSIKHMKPYLQNQQLKAMMLAFLQNKNVDRAHMLKTEDDKSMRNIYLTHHDKVGHLFGLRIGNEIMSSAIIINKLLYNKDKVNVDPKSPIALYVSDKIMDIYENQYDYVQDQMNWSLFTAITFLQLGVYRKYTYDFI